MGARSRPARRATQKTRAGLGARAGTGPASASGRKEDQAPLPLTRDEVLRSLAWTASERPGASGERDADNADKASAGEAGEGDAVICPPVAAGLIADEVLASLDPRRVLGLLVELAGDLKPASSIGWLDLLLLVRNQLEGHDTAMARSRIVAHARVVQRAEVLTSYDSRNTVILDRGGAEAVARRSLQEDGEARGLVETAARQQGLTLADCDARALQRQLDLLIKLDTLGEGAQRRAGRVQDRIERHRMQEARVEREVAREMEMRQSAEAARRRDEERLVREREQHEELRRQWTREAQARQVDRAWEHEKRQQLRRRWQREEGPPLVPTAFPATQETTVEVLERVAAAAPAHPAGDPAGGSGGG